jgi:hypothetical protein
MTKSVEFWVYENYPNNKAVGHQSTCSHLKKNGGDAPRTGRWHGPFATRQEADAAGKNTGRPFHWCKAEKRT